MSLKNNWLEKRFLAFLYYFYLIIICFLNARKLARAYSSQFVSGKLFQVSFEYNYSFRYYLVLAALMLASQIVFLKVMKLS